MALQHRLRHRLRRSTQLVAFWNFPWMPETNKKRSWRPEAGKVQLGASSYLLGRVRQD